MRKSNTFISTSRPDRPLLLVICLVCSFLLHLLVVCSLPFIKQSSSNRFLTEKPTIVRLVDLPKKKPNQRLEYELDQKPEPKNEQKPENAKRLAERNQRVEKEQAPKGIDSRDQTAHLATPAPAQPQPLSRKPVSKQVSPEKKAAELKTNPPIAEHLPAEKSLPQQQPSQTEQQPQKLPSLEQLTRLAPSTLERLNGAKRSQQEKIKQRDDVEQGDEVWLNLEQGLLISFFRRFRNQIEGVWNYPLKAAEQGIQGTLLLKITVDREGKLLDVNLRNSSGSDLLDFEAIQAVYRAAPFGPLPKEYPYPDLKINAHFSYLLTNKFIFGR